MSKFELIDNPASLDLTRIRKEITAGKQVTVQFSAARYTDKLLSDINELCREQDHRFSVRFYGFYSSAFDCRTVLKIPAVKSLLVDCLDEGKNIESITQLENLRSLSLGVRNLADIDILSAPNFRNLRSLVLGEIKSSALNLEHLRDFDKLWSLHVESHTRNIESIGELAGLEELTLHSIKKVPLNFVNGLKKLKNLQLLLGGRENIREIDPNIIETLSICRVRGFNDLSNLGNFSKLRSLSIEDEKQLGAIRFDARFDQLEEVKIINCKTLSICTGLDNLPALTSLTVFGTAIDVEQFLKQPLPKTLRFLGFYTGKTKLDEAIAARIRSMGYETM